MRSSRKRRKRRIDKKFFAHSPSSGVTCALSLPSPSFAHPSSPLHCFSFPLPSLSTFCQVPLFSPSSLSLLLIHRLKRKMADQLVSQTSSFYLQPWTPFVPTRALLFVLERLIRYYSSFLARFQQLSER